MTNTFMKTNYKHQSVRRTLKLTQHLTHHWKITREESWEKQTIYCNQRQNCSQGLGQRGAQEDIYRTYMRHKLEYSSAAFPYLKKHKRSSGEGPTKCSEVGASTGWNEMWREESKSSICPQWGKGEWRRGVMTVFKFLAGHDNAITDQVFEIRWHTKTRGKWQNGKDVKKHFFSNWVLDTLEQA